MSHVNAYIYRVGLVYGLDVGPHADGRQIEVSEHVGNKRRRYLYVVEEDKVFPSKFNLEGRESHHSDIVLSDAVKYKCFKKAFEWTEEWGNGDGKWYADERPGFFKTVRVEYIADGEVCDFRGDASFEIPVKAVKTDWSDEVHATEEKDLSNAQFVEAIRAHVPRPDKKTYLVLDSATGGSTKALTTAFGTGIRVIVPNPEGFELPNATVDKVSLLDYFQTRKAEELAACYFDLTSMPPNAALHLTEMVIQGSMFAGQIIAITASNRRRQAGFKEAAVKTFEAAVRPYFSMELLQYREYARMGFFIFKIF